MAVELEKLADAGITEESLKAAFDTTDGMLGFPKNEKTAALVKRMQSRLTDGRTWNYANGKLYYAIDQLWETPFRAQDEALLRTLKGRDFTKAENKQLLKDWAFTYLVRKVKDPKTGKESEVLNLPQFLNVVVPLASSTTKTRVAKLVTDRIQYPLFKYAPRKTTAANTARCEVITDYVETLTDWFGYRNQMQQIIQKTCIYPNQLSFIQESWYKEEQAGKLQKEGIRYANPHPSRTYYDLSFPISSFNTDTGCQFAGHWEVQAYRTLRENKSLWNTDRIVMGPGWRGPNSTYFNTVYPCTLQQWPDTAGSENDRERAATTYFQTNQDDYGVVTTQHFERIIPSQWGLGNYDDPVWFRFLIASDIVVIYCEPLPAVPTHYWGYDPDDSKTFSPTLILEAAPWEYLVANLLTQIIIAIKQNAVNLTFFNQDIDGMDGKLFQSLSDVTDASLQQLKFIPVSMRKQRAAQNDIRDAILPLQFPQKETTSVMAAIQMAMNLMERCLMVSPQESGASASHQQSAEELRQVGASTSTRLNFTGLAIDSAIGAWKRQLYDYAMAYGSDEVYAAVTSEHLTKKQLEDMGFAVDEVESDDKHWVVTGNKAAIKMEFFASDRDGPSRTNDTAIAAAMLQILQPLAPQLAESIGPDQVTKLFNQWAETIGLPRTFRLTSNPDQNMGVKQSIQKLGAEMAGALKQQEAQFGQALQAEQKQITEAFQAQAQQMQQLGEAVTAIGKTIPQFAQEVQQIKAQLDPMSQALMASIALGKSNQETTAKLSSLLLNATSRPSDMVRFAEAQTQSEAPSPESQNGSDPGIVGQPGQPINAS